MTGSNEDTGIGLFVYDRPEHTQRVLEGLRRNDIDHLYAFADGPKPETDIEAMEEARDVVRDVDFCEVTFIERTENYGVKRSWKEGYDHVFGNHEKAIMLECDCVPSADFIEFMQTCLDRYEDTESVMNVHGYCPPIEIPDGYPYDVFFTTRSGSWGQGTWEDAWMKYEEDPAILERIQREDDLRARVKRAGSDLLPMLEHELADEIDSVGVWWSLALVLNEGLSVNATRSQIANIGHDGSGTHSPDTDQYETDVDLEASQGSFDFPPEVTIDEPLQERYTYHISGGRRGQIRRIIDRVWSVLGIDR